MGRQQLQRRGVSLTLSCVLIGLAVLAVWPQQHALAGGGKDLGVPADDCLDTPGADLRIPSIRTYGISGNNGYSVSVDPMSGGGQACTQGGELVVTSGAIRGGYATADFPTCSLPEYSQNSGQSYYSITAVSLRGCNEGMYPNLTAVSRTADPSSGNLHEGPYGRIWWSGTDPYVVTEGTGSNTKYHVVLGPDLVFKFDDTFAADCSDTDYTGVTLTSASDKLTLTVQRGVSNVIWQFHDFVQTTRRQGQFYSYQTGNSEFYASAYDGGNNIATLSRRFSSAGVYGSPVERVQYGDYTAEGYRGFVYHEYKDGGGSWVPTRRTDFTYDATNGNVDEVTYYAGYDGSGAGSDLANWDDEIGKMVFRYDVNQRLIIALDTQAVASAQADGVDPLAKATSNAVLEDHATRVFTYDTGSGGTAWKDGRVATISGADCGGCGSGGGGSIAVSWAQNSSVTGTGGVNRYDYWWRRSTEEVKDENGDVYRRTSTYINRAGKVLCRIVESRSDVFGAGGDLQKADITFYEYNSDGRLIKTYERSAVDTYPTDVDGEVDLTTLDTKNTLEESGGLVMHTDEGVIRLIDYYSATTATTANRGGVDGYVQYHKIQNGTAGSAITLRELKYIKHTGNGVDVYPIAEEVRYLEGTSAWVSTRWEYNFPSVKHNIPDTITRYRFVDENDNDTVNDDALVETLVQDVEQNRVWRKDEQGVITYYLRDDIQEVGMIVDPDTDEDGVGEVFNGVTIPTGFTNSGGRHLRTDIQTDDHNRVTRVLGPEYDADADDDGDMDDAVRPVRWTVYKDSTYDSVADEWSRSEVRSASGYYAVVADTYHLVGGIGVRLADRGEGSSDVLWTERYTTERATGVSGELTETENVVDDPDLRWSGWTRTKNVAGQVTERHMYFDIPDTGYGDVADEYLVTATAYHLDGTVRYVEGPDGTRTYTFRDKKTVGGETIYEARRYSVYEDTGSKWQLAGPISVSWADEDGRTVRGFTATVSGALAGESADHPAGTDSLVELSRSAMTYDWRHRALERWSYFDLTDGAGHLDEDEDGTEGTHYVVSETLAYDEQGRVLRTQAPSGDISAVVYDALGRTKESWVGTSATGATRTDPGAGASDLVTVSQAFYDDDGDGAGDPTPYLIRAERLKPNETGTLDGSSDEFTGVTYVYDDLGRRTQTRPDVGPWSEVTYSDAGQAIKAVAFADTGNGIPENSELLTQSATVYDGAGWVTESRVYEVDGTNAPTKYLLSTVEYDDLGRQALGFNAQGAGTLTEWDDAGRVVRQITFSDNGGDDSDPSDDIVVTESEVEYWASGAGAGRPKLRTRYQRLNTASASTVNLLSANGLGRATYSATWYDEGGRVTHAAYYGTNGGSAPTVTATPPASSSTVLVTQTSFDDAARADQVTASDSVVTKIFYNDAGQRTHVVENYDAAKLTGGDPDTPASRDADVNRITAFVYNHELGAVVEQVAVDPDHDGNASDNQSTRYVYSDELTDKGTPSGGLQSNSLLRAVIYPDSDDTVSSNVLDDGTDAAHDRVELTYYSDATLKAREDQNGTVLTRIYHDDGALQYQDAAPGTGIDTAIKSIGYDYDDLRRVTTVTQYDDVSTGTPTAVNEVVNTYTDLGQLSSQYQEHDGTKKGSTLSVGYEYDATIAGNKYTEDRRLDAVVYPDERHVFHRYGSNGSIEHELGMVSSIWDDNGSGAYGAQQVRYYQDGVSGVGRVVYPMGASTNVIYDPDYDRFLRVETVDWAQGSSQRIEIDYGYDLASRRVYHEDVLAATNSEDLDQFDTRNAFGELTNWQLGGLNGTQDAIPTADRDVTQDWTLDQLGNWADFHHDTNGDEDFTDDDDLDQARTNNDVNEITGITEPGNQTAWATPAYDKSGNMIEIPQPNAPASSYDATYDAWGRLVKLEDGANTVAEYEYDGLGRRIIKHVYDSGTFDYSDHAYYNGWQVIEVRRDTDGTSGGDPDADPMEQFVYHTYYIDAVAVRYWDDPDDGGGLDGTQVEQYYAHDAQFNVVALMEDDGTVLERYRYAPYGEQTVMDASYAVKTGGTDYAQYKGFTGQTLDKESGLWYFRSRYYSDGLGQFLSRDPSGYSDGMNAYAGYFGMWSGVDPSGQYTLSDAEESLKKRGVGHGNAGVSWGWSAAALMRGGTIVLPQSPSYTKQQIFDEWIRLEKTRTAWWQHLPKCPCDISCTKTRTRRVCVDYEVNVGGSAGSVRYEYRNITESYESICNPDDSLWDDPIRPSWAESSLHPGAYYSMRSKPHWGNSNQCIYDSDGKLLTDLPSAGSADYRAPGVNTGHRGHDVTPVLLANQLDGGVRPSTTLGLVRGVTQMVVPAGANVTRYYEVRPSWHEDCGPAPLPFVGPVLPIPFVGPVRHISPPTQAFPPNPGEASCPGGCGGLGPG